MLSFKRCLVIWLLLIPAIMAHAQQSTPITLKELLSQVTQKAPSLLTDSAAILKRQAQAAKTRSTKQPNQKQKNQTEKNTSNITSGPYFGFGIVPSSSGGLR